MATLQERFPLQRLGLGKYLPDTVMHQFRSYIGNGTVIDYLRDLLDIYGEEEMGVKERGYLRQYLDNRDEYEVGVTCRGTLERNLTSMVADLLRNQHEHEVTWQVGEGILPEREFPIRYLAIGARFKNAGIRNMGYKFGDITIAEFRKEMKKNPDFLRKINGIGEVKERLVLDAIDEFVSNPHMYQIEDSSQLPLEE